MNLGRWHLNNVYSDGENKYSCYRRTSDIPSRHLKTMREGRLGVYFTYIGSRVILTPQKDFCIGSDDGNVNG